MVHHFPQRGFNQRLLVGNDALAEGERIPEGSRQPLTQGRNAFVPVNALGSAVADAE